MSPLDPQAPRNGISGRSRRNLAQQTSASAACRALGRAGLRTLAHPCYEAVSVGIVAR